LSKNTIYGRGTIGDGSRKSGRTETGDGLALWVKLPGGMAVFGSATPVSKIVTGAVPVFIASLFRVALGALVLAPLAWRQRGDIARLSRGDWGIVFLIALFGMFGFSALMLFGMRMVSGVAGAIVMSTAPAVTALASMLFMGDSPTWRKLAAIALAVVGVMVLQLGSSGGGGGSAEGGTAWVGIGLVFAAVCSESVYTLLGKKASAEADPTLVAFLSAAMSIPLFVPFAVWQWAAFDPRAVETHVWVALVWYGAGTLSLGTWLWYSGLRAVEGSVAAVFMGVMPVSALVLSYILLGESFQWMHLLGFGIVFAGVLLISWEHARMS
jgi:drug/metabolite transporter (DMT)-like permease